MKPDCEFRFTHGVLLFAGYVLFDWASNFQSLYDLNITPWNPTAALGIVFILLYGWRAALPVLLAIIVGDAWMRATTVSLTSVVLLAVIVTAGYLGIAGLLRRHLRDSGLFVNQGGLLMWMLIVIVGTLIISAVFSAALVLLSLLPASMMPQALAGHWIGNCVGIIVAMPFIWLLTNAAGRAALMQIIVRVEAAAIVVTTALVFAVAFGFGSLADYKYFYLLFLPTIWSAARFGFAGAALVAVVNHVGIAVSINYLDFGLVSAFEIQILTVVLASVGFLLGIAVDEQNRINEDLQQSLRLAAAGEMAGAIAHELNQPLTAIAAYGNTCEEILAQGNTREDLREPMHRIVKESIRAAEIVRRLRDFFRSGTTRLEELQVASPVRAAAEPFFERAKHDGVRFTVSAELRCRLFADGLQLEVVLRNLLANAFDAVASRPPDSREVAVEVRLEGADKVCIAVRDSGPGLTEEMHEKLYEPFRSTKTSGLGLGLVISRAIAKAHGGCLRAFPGSFGLFELILPVEKDINHDSR